MRLDGSVATAERCESCTSVYAAVQYEVSYDPCTIVHIDQYDINSHMYTMSMMIDNYYVIQLAAVNV